LASIILILTNFNLWYLLSEPSPRLPKKKVRNEFFKPKQYAEVASLIGGRASSGKPYIIEVWFYQFPVLTVVECRHERWLMDMRHWCRTSISEICLLVVDLGVVLCTNVILPWLLLPHYSQLSLMCNLRWKVGIKLDTTIFRGILSSDRSE